MKKIILFSMIIALLAGCTSDSKETANLTELNTELSDDLKNSQEY